jgi:hypothetical protein
MAGFRNGPAFLFPELVLLLFIKARYNFKNIVISFSKKGKSVLRGLLFLQFCKKYDICNPNQAISGCAFGKISQVLTRPFFITYSQCICTLLISWFLTRNLKFSIKKACPIPIMKYLIDR